MSQLFFLKKQNKHSFFFFRTPVCGTVRRGGLESRRRRARAPARRPGSRPAGKRRGVSRAQLPSPAAAEQAGRRGGWPAFPPPAAQVRAPPPEAPCSCPAGRPASRGAGPQLSVTLSPDLRPGGASEGLPAAQFARLRSAAGGPLRGAGRGGRGPARVEDAGGGALVRPSRRPPGQNFLHLQVPPVKGSTVL